MAKSDEELVLEMQGTKNNKTHQKLFAIVVERNYKPLTSYVKMLMRSNPFEVSDVVHNSLIKAWDSFALFDNKARVLTWLCAIARNDYFNMNRDAGRQPPQQDVPIDSFILDDMSVDDPDYIMIKDQLMEVFTEFENPETIYQSVETLEEIEDVVEDLPEYLQELFVLRYIDQLDYKEISIKLGWPLGTLKNRLFELNSIIKQIINPNNEGC